jgi:uncharacterized membrane protein YoaK (UPF0700 family)
VNIQTSFEEPALRTNRTLVLSLVSCCVLGGLGLALFAWPHTWDDSAITLGYSRTLAESGEIRFGRHGERVEGFSSFLWMLVTAALGLIDSRPDAMLTLAKVGNAALYLANIWLLLKLVAALALPRGVQWLPAAAFALTTVSIVSIVDGMENHLFVMLHLVLLLEYIRLRQGAPAKPLLAGARIGCWLFVLLVCRPEGVLTTGALVGALLIERRQLTRGSRVALLIGLAVAAAAFGAFVGWRWAYFGGLTPNTVYAKQWPPYLRPLDRRLNSGAETVIGFLVATFAWIVPLALHRRDGVAIARGLWTAGRRYVFPVLLIVVFCGYQVAIGRLSGTAHRILLPIVPCLFLLGALALSHLTVRPPAWRVVAAVAIFASAQSVYFAEYLRHEVTVTRIKALVEPGMELALLVGHSPPTVALPDVGATVLWWGNDVRLIDTALLNNGRAAREGWSALESTMFDGGQPDLIETHGIWSRFGGLHESQEIKRSYTCVTINERFYLLRNDHVERVVRGEIPRVTARAVDQLSASQRETISQRRWTDFRADDTGIELPWTWALDLAPAVR